MNAIIIDDESYCSDYLEMMCMQIKNLTIASVFSDAYQALSYLESHAVDLVFMDIELPGLNGMDAYRQMRLLRPHLGVIFVTGYEEYALEAFQVDALSYLLKPCNLSELEHAVEKACKFLPPTQRVQIQTFGRFQLMIDGEAYHFSNGKAKELLALAIDKKGGIVTMEQAVDLLWEDHPYDEAVKQLYRKAVICLNQLCKDKGLDFFVSNRGSCHILPSRLECDYYKLLEGSPDSARIFYGEYLLDYSWAEETVARIQNYINSGGLC